RRGDRYARIGEIDAAARKDVSIGHEGVLGVATAQQHFRHLAALAHQDQRRRIARPQVGILLIELLDRALAAGLQRCMVVTLVGAPHDRALRNASSAHAPTIDQLTGVSGRKTTTSLPPPGTPMRSGAESGSARKVMRSSLVGRP